MIFDSRAARVIMLALTMAAGCSQYREEGLYSKSIAEDEFSASMEYDSQGTRSHLDGQQVLWSAVDSVSIFYGKNTNEKYRVKKGCEDKTTTTLTAAPWEGTPSGDGTALKACVALYPAQKETACSAGSKDGEYTLNATLEGTQSYKAGSFAEGAFPMVAVTSSSSERLLQFKNVCGVLKFSFKGDGNSISKIKLRGNNGEKLSGEATISCSRSGEPVITMSEGSSTEVVLDCGSGIKLSTGEATGFYMAVRPVTFSKGITIVMQTSEGTYSRSTSSSLTIKRSTIKSMSTMTVDDNDSFTAIDGEVGIFSLLSPSCRIEGWSTDGTLQYATYSDEDYYYQDIYSFAADSLTRLLVPKDLSVGEEVIISKKCITSTSESNRSFIAKVVKSSGERVWLKTSVLGFIIDTEQ